MFGRGPKKLYDHRISPIGGMALCGAREVKRGHGKSKCADCERIHAKQKQRNIRTASIRRAAMQAEATAGPYFSRYRTTEE